MQVYQRSLPKLKVPLRSYCNKYTFYINPRVKKFLQKRRKQRDQEWEACQMEYQEISFKKAQTWKHVRRHAHAKKRRRGYRGRFLSKAESNELDRQELLAKKNNEFKKESEVKAIQPNIQTEVLKACKLPSD